MATQRAFYWIMASGLIGIALTAGLHAAMGIAASVGLYLACDQIFFGGNVTAL
jgi:hypothetical protein